MTYEKAKEIIQKKALVKKRLPASKFYPLIGKAMSVIESIEGKERKNVAINNDIYSKGLVNVLQQEPTLLFDGGLDF